MKRFGSILTFLTCSLPLAASIAFEISALLASSSEASDGGSSGRDIVMAMTPLIYLLVALITVCGLLYLLTLLFSFIGIWTKKGGIKATSKCALIALIVSIVALLVCAVGTFVTDDVVNFVSSMYGDEMTEYMFLLGCGVLSGWFFLIFLFSLISKPKKEKK